MYLVRGVAPAAGHVRKDCSLGKSMHHCQQLRPKRFAIVRLHRPALPLALLQLCITDLRKNVLKTVNHTNTRHLIAI